METCAECSMLERILSRANRRYASLVLQQDRMVRDGNEGGVFEDAIQQEEGIRTFAARALLAHCANHTQSHAKTITAHYL
jgi:hypothetical protein